MVKFGVAVTYGYISLKRSKHCELQLGSVLLKGSECGGI